MNILKLCKFTLAGEGGVDCCCRAAGGGAAEILLKGYFCKVDSLAGEFCDIESVIL